jgi:hypothetical protein
VVETTGHITLSLRDRENVNAVYLLKGERITSWLRAQCKGVQISISLSDLQVGVTVANLAGKKNINMAR